uniref:Uncharacterized protein n=1 Tax=Cacopsylla melanoneura TaxID=428564 RepID=A0A8D8ZFV5_9HEMI
MTLRSAVLILANILYNGIQCNAEQTDNNNSTKDADLDYYEFRLKHGDPLNYEEFIKKVMGKNKSTTEDLYAVMLQARHGRTSPTRRISWSMFRLRRSPSTGPQPGGCATFGISRRGLK